MGDVAEGLPLSPARSISTLFRWKRWDCVHRLITTSASSYLAHVSRVGDCTRLPALLPPGCLPSPHTFNGSPSPGPARHFAHDTKFALNSAHPHPPALPVLPSVTPPSSLTQCHPHVLLPKLHDLMFQIPSMCSGLSFHPLSASSLCFNVSF